jgi:hypothetical protein
MARIDRKALETIVEEYGLYNTVLTLAEMCRNKIDSAETCMATSFYTVSAIHLEVAASRIAEFSNSMQYLDK